MFFEVLADCRYYVLSSEVSKVTEGLSGLPRFHNCCRDSLETSVSVLTVKGSTRHGACCKKVSFLGKGHSTDMRALI